jgi:hypothetical protein
MLQQKVQEYGKVPLLREIRLTPGQKGPPKRH